MLTSETASSVSTPSKNHGGDPADERKMPAAAACVSVGELRGALDWPREFRAMRMCDGLVVIVVGLMLGKWDLLGSGHPVRPSPVRVQGPVVNPAFRK